MAYGITPTHNGRILQNLILAANYLHSHILHFYQLSALDFVDVKAVLQYKGKDRLLISLKQWIEETLARKDVSRRPRSCRATRSLYIKERTSTCRLWHTTSRPWKSEKSPTRWRRCSAGRVPHSTALVPGGVTQVPTLERILSYRARLKKVMEFAESVYVPDLLEVAKVFPQYFEIGRGRDNFLSFGVFPMGENGNKFIKAGAVIGGKWESLNQENIVEEVGYSRFSQSAGRHPKDGQTIPEAEKANAYSSIKAPGIAANRWRSVRCPRDGQLSRSVGHVDQERSRRILGQREGSGREVEFGARTPRARGLEALWVGKQAESGSTNWTSTALPPATSRIPKTALGYGLTEAPRGALGHWLSIDNYLIKNYQCVVPTTWNCSPRDDKGQPGPIEYALAGTIIEDPEQPIEVGRHRSIFRPVHSLCRALIASQIIQQPTIHEEQPSMSQFSRREVLKLGALLAAGFGLDSSYSAIFAAGLEKISNGQAKVLWLQGMLCSGCSVSFPEFQMNRAPPKSSPA